MKPLPREFYLRHTVNVARDLIGTVIVRELDNGLRLVGRIVEAEAYRGADDPGSHAYRGRTERNWVMFEEGGRAYVYFTYGMHYCFNVTTEPTGKPGAVLIRAVEPLEGVDMMKALRGGAKNLYELASGPARLTQAFKITPQLYGHDLTSGQRLFIAPANSRQRDSEKIISTKRVGIKTGLDRNWRFLLDSSKFLSKR